MANPSERRGEVGRWLDFAEEDLAYGRLGMEAFPRAAAWSFQQATEKALKAILTLHGQVPQRTHDVLVLFNAVTAVSDGWEPLRAAVVRLAEIAASSRYPDDLPPVGSAEVKAFDGAAQNIVVHARRVWTAWQGEEPGPR
jgi:HEPN domain-containing protein